MESTDQPPTSALKKQQQQQKQQPPQHEKQGAALFFCHLCKSEYRQPKLLKCLHSFCKLCLQDILVQESDNDFVICPLCSYATDLPPSSSSSSLPPGGVESLADNHFLQRISGEYVTEVKGNIANSLSPQTARKLGPYGAYMAKRRVSEESVHHKLAANLTDEQKTTVTSRSLRFRDDAPLTHALAKAETPAVGFSEFRRASVDRGEYTISSQEGVNNMSRLQGKMMSLQGEALRVTYAIDRINHHTTNWHQHKEDLKLEVQRRSNQFQAAVKKIERQIVSQIESKAMEDKFYAELDRGKTDLRRNLKNILHEVSVLKSVHEMGRYSEINDMSDALLGQSIGTTQITLDMLSYQLDIPTKPIEEMVAVGFGNLVTKQEEESNVYVPELKNFINAPLDQLTTDYPPVPDYKTTEVEEGAGGAESKTERTRGRSVSRRALAKATGSKRYTSDLGLGRTNVMQQLVEFQNARESFRTRRQEIMRQGQYAREDLSPVGIEGRKFSMPSLAGRVQSLERSSNADEGRKLATMMRASNREAATVSYITQGQQRGDPSDAYQVAEEPTGQRTPQDLDIMPSTIIEEERFTQGGGSSSRIQAKYLSQTLLAGRDKGDREILTALPLLGRQRTISQSSSGRQSSFDETPPESPTSEHSGDSDFRTRANEGGGGGRPLRKSISSATDKRSKIEFLRENWQKRKEILIQSQGFVSSETTATSAGKPNIEAFAISSPGQLQFPGSCKDDSSTSSGSSSTSSQPAPLGSQFTSASSRYQQEQELLKLARATTSSPSSAAASTAFTTRHLPSALVTGQQASCDVAPDVSATSPEEQYEEHVETITIPVTASRHDARDTSPSPEEQYEEHVETITIPVTASRDDASPTSSEEQYEEHVEILTIPVTASRHDASPTSSEEQYEEHVETITIPVSGELLQQIRAGENNGEPTRTKEKDAKQEMTIKTETFSIGKDSITRNSSTTVHDVLDNSPLGSKEGNNVPLATVSSLNRKSLNITGSSVEAKTPYVIASSVEAKTPYVIASSVEPKTPYATASSLEPKTPYTTASSLELKTPYATASSLEPKTPYSTSIMRPSGETLSITSTSSSNLQTMSVDHGSTLIAPSTTNIRSSALPSTPASRATATSSSLSTTRNLLAESSVTTNATNATISSTTSISSVTTTTLSSASTTISTAAATTSTAAAATTAAAAAATTNTTSYLGKYSRRYVPRIETIDVAALIANMYKPSPSTSSLPPLSPSSQKEDEKKKEDEEKKKKDDEEKENVKNENDKRAESQANDQSGGNQSDRGSITRQTFSPNNSLNTPLRTSLIEKKSVVDSTAIKSGDAKTLKVGTTNIKTLDTKTSMIDSTHAKTGDVSVAKVTTETETVNTFALPSSRSSLSHGRLSETERETISSIPANSTTPKTPERFPTTKNTDLHSDQMPGSVLSPSPSDQKVDLTFNQAESSRKRYTPTSPAASSAARRSRRHTVEISKTLPEGMRMSDLYKPATKETELTVYSRLLGQPQTDLHRTVIEEAQDEYVKDSMTSTTETLTLKGGPPYLNTGLISISSSNSSRRYPSQSGEEASGYHQLSQGQAHMFSPRMTPSENSPVSPCSSVSDDPFMPTTYDPASGQGNGNNARGKLRDIARKKKERWRRLTIS